MSVELPILYTSGIFQIHIFLKLDVDGFVCWNCNKEFSFVEDEEPFVTEDGQKYPGHED